MKIYLKRSKFIGIAGLSLLFVLVLGACSSSDDPAASNDSSSTEQSGSSGNGQNDEASAERDETLENFPLPDETVFLFPGDRTPNSNGTETMSQSATVPMNVTEVAQFMFDGLEDAGYTVRQGDVRFAASVDELESKFGGTIGFTDDQGRTGQVTLLVQGATTGLNFNIELRQ